MVQSRTLSSTQLCIVYLIEGPHVCAHKIEKLFYLTMLQLIMIRDSFSTAQLAFHNKAMLYGVQD